MPCPVTGHPSKRLNSAYPRKQLLRTTVNRQGRLARHVTFPDVLRYGIATAFINCPVTPTASGVQGQNISCF